MGLVADIRPDRRVGRVNGRHRLELPLCQDGSVWGELRSTRKKADQLGWSAERRLRAPRLSPVPPQSFSFGTASGRHAAAGASRAARSAL